MSVVRNWILKLLFIGIAAALTTFSTWLVAHAFHTPAHISELVIFIISALGILNYVMGSEIVKSGQRNVRRAWIDEQADTYMSKWEVSWETAAYAFFEGSILQHKGWKEWGQVEFENWFTRTYYRTPAKAEVNIAA